MFSTDRKQAASKGTENCGQGSGSPTKSIRKESVDDAGGGPSQRRASGLQMKLKLTMTGQGPTQVVGANFIKEKVGPFWPRSKESVRASQSRGGLGYRKSHERTTKPGII